MSEESPKSLSVPQNWSSTTMFILAVTGTAVGFSNVWQFPHHIAEHGGALFLIAYAVVMVLVGLPVMTSEFMVGRIGKASPLQTIRSLVDNEHCDPNWNVLGSIKTFTGLLVFSYLAVIGGWMMAYGVRAAAGVFDGVTADGMNAIFSEHVRDPERQLFWHSLFVVMTMIVAGRGLKRGIEPVVRVVVPAMFLMLVLFMAYAVSMDTFKEATTLLWAVDTESFDWRSVLIALGHAFFSLGVGFGALLMFGAYLPDDASVSVSAVWVVGLDTLVGIVASVLVFSLLFASKQDPVAGPALLFQALPLAFDLVPYGRVVLTLMYVFLAAAAWITAIALIEPAVVWLIESHDMTRFRAAVWSGVGVWLIGIVTIFSFESWSFEFEYFGSKKYLGLFDVLQIATSHFLLPGAGILIVLFAGWSLKEDLTQKAMGLGAGRLYRFWLVLARFVTPVLLVVLMFAIPVLFL